MIPEIERLIKEALERRVVTAMPGLELNEEGFPACVVTYIESRKIYRNVQEQPDVKFFGEIEAVYAMQFNSRGLSFLDKTPLFASFMEHPFLTIDDDTHAKCELEGASVAEGPHIDIDVLDFRVIYPIYDRLTLKEWQPPQLGDADTNAPDLYPRPGQDKRDEPETHV